MSFLHHAWPIIVLVFISLVVLVQVIVRIGADEMGVVTKKWSLSTKKLSAGNVVALEGEPGYQDKLLRPGIHIINPIVYSVQKFPIPVVPPGTIGIVYAQVGLEMPSGAKTAAYKKEFGKFTDVRTFIQQGGQKGIQRPVLQSGESAFVHPVGFLVITKHAIYGLPISSEFQGKGNLNLSSFNLVADDLDLVVIGPEEGTVEEFIPGDDGKPKKTEVKRMIDMIGIVTTEDGPPVERGDIACRIGGFDDLASLEQGFSTAPAGTLSPTPAASDASKEPGGEKQLDDAAQRFMQQLMGRRDDNAKLVSALLDSKNKLHNSYQDFQAFLEAGGKMGIQHDPLLPGTYALNPVAVHVTRVPMLVVNQGEVMVIKSSLGLPTVDTSGKDFKHGSLVRPGHIGIWEMAIGTGKYPFNPRVYQPIDVKTYILNLSWAAEQSMAHTLDHRLSTIKARSKEGFEFSIDLQVQIHVPDLLAPLVICMVGTMENLVSEVLHPAVGNHFRDKLQGMSAVTFIETREQVQQAALFHIRTALRGYYIEVLGVYIQDVIPPADLVEVLKNREIANQNKTTYTAEAAAQVQRAQLEKERGTANKQGELAQSAVTVEIKTNLAQARTAEANGEAAYIEKTGAAQGAEVRAVNMALADAFAKQVQTLGAEGTTAVNVARAIASAVHRLVPDVLVNGGSGGTSEGILGLVTKQLLQTGALTPTAQTAAAKKETPPDPGVTKAAPPTV